MPKTPALKLLGRVEVEGATGPPLPQKARALLCILARSPGKPVSRDYVAGMLWSGSDQHRARTSFRQTLRRLRLVLGSDRLKGTRDDVVFDPGPMTIDLACLEAARSSDRIEDVLAAAEMFVGDFAADVEVDGEPAQDWIANERARIRDWATDLTLRAVDAHLKADTPEAARDLAVRFLEIDPFLEPMHRSLIEALAAMGRRSAAVEHYRVLREMLATELGVQPDEQTEALLAKLLESRPASAEPEPAVVALTHPGTELAGMPAIAVLPIEVFGQRRGLSHLARGFAEELIVSLSGWRSFPVVSPASSLIEPDGSPGHAALGRRLDARYVVVSKLHSDGSEARLTSRLVASETGRQLWAGGYRIELANLLSIQEELAATIAGVIQQRTVQSELQRIVWKRTSELDAWEHHVLGQQELQKFSKPANAAARAHFNAALEIDPEYSDAHVGISTSYCWDTQYVAEQDKAPLLDLAEASAARALEIDWNAPLAHTRLGAVHTWRGDFDRGLAETELALHLNPSETSTRLAFGNRLDLVGRATEGISHMETGARLNPLDPRSANYLGYLARAHLAAGAADTARRWAQRAVALRPNDPDMHFRLAACAAGLDDLDAAKAALRTCERLETGFVDRKRDWRPYSDAPRNDAFFDGLRRHALM